MPRQPSSVICAGSLSILFVHEFQYLAQSSWLKKYLRTSLVAQDGNPLAVQGTWFDLWSRRIPHAASY